LGSENETAIPLLGSESLWTIQSKQDDNYKKVVYEVTKLVTGIILRHLDDAPPAYGPAALSNQVEENEFQPPVSPPKRSPRTFNLQFSWK
jgi:hypothetical protein